MPTHAQSPDSSVLSSDQLETPLGDNRSYERFVMGNKLEVFLAHDAARLGGDPYRVDPRVDLGLDRLVSVGVDSRVDA